MKNGTKYLSFLVVLMFVVGQIQYGYTTYFCTMMNEFLPSAPVMLSSQYETDTCSQCDGVLAAQQSSQTFAPNCFQINSLQKDVISTFTAAGNHDLYVVNVAAPIVIHPQVAQTTLWSLTIAPATSSPPLDLPTFNSNLRI